MIIKAVDRHHKEITITNTNMTPSLKKLRKLSVILVLLGSSSLLYAQTATQQLRSFVEKVSAATGEFSQRTVDVQGKERPAQTGEFAFKRPGQFKWQVLKPYEQLVLSDGKQLYQYDPDLNQLTQRGVGDAIGASPAAILFGSGQLDQSFDLSERPDAEDLTWLRAKPKGADAGFEYVDIGFKAATPVRLILLDAFGQQTLIDLSNIDTSVDLQPKDFTFVPPADVDVVTLP